MAVVIWAACLSVASNTWMVCLLRRLNIGGKLPGMYGISVQLLAAQGGPNLIPNEVWL